MKKVNYSEFLYKDSVNELYNQFNNRFKDFYTIYTNIQIKNDNYQLNNFINTTNNILKQKLNKLDGLSDKIYYQFINQYGIYNILKYKENYLLDHLKQKDKFYLHYYYFKFLKFYVYNFTIKNDKCLKAIENYIQILQVNHPLFKYKELKNIINVNLDNWIQIYKKEKLELNQPYKRFMDLYNEPWQQNQSKSILARGGFACKQSF